jgi:tetratricopeptide (TPR) repeat protein
MPFYWVLVVAILVCAAPTSTAAADDSTARAHFELARAAFEATDYEKALVHFQEAYELSGRAELQYNIGVTASRLRRDEEALVAFERYLAELEQPARELEVRKRIEAIRPILQQRQTVDQTQPVDQTPTDTTRIPRSAIVGASFLAAVGVTGVAAMGVGVARSGECLEEVGGNCLATRAATPWVGVYGGIGIAALAGSAIWLGISGKRAKEKRSTAWMLSLTGIMVSSSF